MTKIEIGKKYTTRDGREARILCVDRVNGNPVVALIGKDNSVYTYTSTGQWQETPHSKYDVDLIEVSPYDDFNIDDKVMVQLFTNSQHWHKRYFAGVDSSGQPTAWDSGGTSWSSKGRTAWSRCRRPEEHELRATI